MKKKEELYSCSQQDHNAMAETDIKMVPIADLHDFEGHQASSYKQMPFHLVSNVLFAGYCQP